MEVFNKQIFGVGAERFLAKTIDIWNALVIDCTIELNHNSKCFTTIKFN